MVSTRSSSRADSAGPEPTPTSTSTPSTPTPATRKRKPATSAPSTTTRRRAHRASAFEHTPTFWTLLWMAVSLPLVIWDTGYVLGRPHTMEGGAAHWPLWLPYKLYGEVDHIYGWKAFHANNGFTAAQGLLNVVETLMYAVYLWLWYSRGEATAHGRVVTGRPGALAVLIGFSSAVMTLSKTFLYWSNEYFSGFDNIGHNNPVDLVFLWIIPNGAWLIGSAYMAWSIGAEILDGLEAASHVKKE
ncbi:hypothetical protein X797_007112 [Metarhizium robertsii]|uniref:C6 transcription factor n=2 Tax=Metarhizium robertsii TaxID=568076 RepID=E9F4H5_METRA|nr:C6 transcription factor [Metarhizium robertsii ARSEF 23]EFY97532.2 C6 transcription factor [Metarhizium robertsii ARSEF 23]EXU99645.1 hypothetical protein X797_007112 [Metarhizium robertsii]